MSSRKESEKDDHESGSEESSDGEAEEFMAALARKLKETHLKEDSKAQTQTPPPTPDKAAKKPKRPCSQKQLESLARSRAIRAQKRAEKAEQDKAAREGKGKETKGSSRKAPEKETEGKAAAKEKKKETKDEEEDPHDELPPKKPALKRSDPPPREESPEPVERDTGKEHRAAMKKNLASRIAGQYNAPKQDKYHMVKPFFSE